MNSFALTPREQPEKRERAPSTSFHHTQRDLVVVNPTSGARIAVYVTQPSGAASAPLVVMVPGGLSAGRLSFGISGIAERFARRGYAVATFDPDGRGASSGTEDYGGHIHQDGLAAVLEAVAAIPNIAADRAALVSFSYGATIASGMLARHRPPIGCYLDWEGPALRRQARRILATAIEGPLPAEAQTDGSWWEEREVAPFLREIASPYERIQSEQDHAQVSPDHARVAIRSATSVEHGGEGQAPWTRLNGNLPNTIYDSGFEPHWLPALPAEIAVFAYLVELLPPALPA